MAAENCYKQADYAQLAAMPAENVLVISNLGAPMLRYTPHRVLAGPYHRNMDGNIAALEAFIGTPEKAREVARANNIGLVAFCRGNAETAFLAGRAPEGLLAGLASRQHAGLAGDGAGKQGQAARAVPRPAGLVMLSRGPNPPSSRGVSIQEYLSTLYAFSRYFS